MESSKHSDRPEWRSPDMPDAQAALCMSLSKLQAILDAETRCVKLLEPDSTLCEINHSGLEILEVDSPDAVVGKRLLPIFVPPEDHAPVKAMFDAVARGQRGTAQFRIIGLKGTTRWLECTAVPYYNEDNGRDLVLSISRDITARKKDEEQIRRLNRLYGVSSAINDAIVRIGDTTELFERTCRIAVEQGGLLMAWIALVDPDGKSLKPIARWGKDEGYLDRLVLSTGADEAAGQGPGGRAFRSGAPAFCNDISDPAEVFVYRQEALQRGYRSCAAFPLKIEGSPFGLLVVYSEITGYFDKEELRVLTALADNLAFAAESHQREKRRRQAEASLRASEARFRTFMANSPAAGWIVNREGRFSYVNDAFYRMFGVEQNPEGRTIEEVFDSPLAEIYLENNRLAFEAGQAVEVSEIANRPDGSTGEFLVVKFPISVAGESPLLGALALDVTERKSLEQQLLRAQRMESLGTLASGIAHDLNNALCPIITSFELLMMDFTDPGSQELLAIVRASAQRGADMVRQVLSFARGVEGARVEVQLKHIVRDIQKIAEDTFLKHIQVETAIPPGLWSVIGDPTQLHQVILNLCVNARDAMPDGGTLTLSAENRLLDARAASSHLDAKAGPYVVIEVRDNGTGIPAGIVDKIFEPFFTTKEVGKGTGLGLSISMGIVKSHGGFFQVESKPGHGTCFRVFIPAQSGPARAVEAESAPHLPRGNDELILLVDDEAGVRDLTRRTLEAFGYRAVLASDGAEAVGIFATRSKEIRLVLLDLTMPRMDGFATIVALRQLNPRIPIVAASGLAIPDHKERSLALGVANFLSKPYTAETLLKVLHAILGGGSS